MRGIWGGILAAFSMYSTVPVPQVKWDKDTLKWALGFLPLVGVLAGVVEWIWYAFCELHGASAVFYSVIAALIPVVISGGIHLDGLCDTCDALCSYAGKEKRLEILKDPHVGAFGPMWLTAFLLAEAACFAQVYEIPKYLPLALAGFAFSRALGGCKIVLTKCAKDSGLAYIFAENSNKAGVTAMLASEVLLFMLFIFFRLWNEPYGLLAGGVCFALLIFWYALHNIMCLKIFGGVTGDLAGFFISVCELAALVCAAFGGLLF